MLYERFYGVGDELDLRPLRKMTAHAELSVRTTLREAYSDGSLRFTWVSSAARASASLLSPRRASGLIVAPERLRAAPRNGSAGLCSEPAFLGIDKLAITVLTQHPVCSIQR